MHIFKISICVIDFLFNVFFILFLFRVNVVTVQVLSVQSVVIDGDLLSEKPALSELFYKHTLWRMANEM